MTALCVFSVELFLAKSCETDLSSLSDIVVVSGHIGTYLEELTSMSILTVCILDQRSQTIHAQVSGSGEQEEEEGIR